MKEHYTTKAKMKMGEAGDVVITDKLYADFEFSIDWKISQGGNSQSEKK